MLQVELVLIWAPLLLLLLRLLLLLPLLPLVLVHLSLVRL